MEQGLGMDLRDCSKWTCGYVHRIREWVSVPGMGWGGGEEGMIKLNPLMFFLLVYISRRDIMLVFFGLFDCITFLQSRIVMNKNETEEQMPKTVKMSGHPFIAFLLFSHVK